MRRTLISLAAMTALCCRPVGAAEPDTFLRAVDFALEGGEDAARVHVLDRRNCVFMIHSNPDGTGEVFHLNNVETDRIRISPWSNAFSRWVQVELSGAGVVYAFTGPRPEGSGVLTSQQAEVLQNMVRPRQAMS